MDRTETHYLTYDAETIMADMMMAYVEAGGDILYPGDEKEMLLRSVLQVIVQCFAGIDNALRMDTLRYAVREYLDIYGEKRGCVRIQAQPAEATIKITLAATGTERFIPEGTAFTADGSVLYLTTEDIAAEGIAQEVYAQVRCQDTGAIGNGLTAGVAVSCGIPVEGLTGAVCTTSAHGGQDREDDEAYRERIRVHGLSAVTTGPAQRYEAQAMEVSSEILDARAINGGAGNVLVYLLTRQETGQSALIAQVEEALSGETARPLTDTVTVALATKIPYELDVNVAYEGGAAVQSALSQAVTEYQDWQERTIGRAFNPEKLAAMLYQAGATRVVWGEGSHFDEDGDIEYTEIEANEYVRGTISLAVIE